MAVITLQTIGSANPAQWIAARLKAVSATMRSVIDSYVSYRMQTSASQAEHVRRPVAGTAKAGSSTVVPAQDPACHALQPLDPGTISDAIPAFFVGRNNDGLWAAREAKGEIGGLFVFKESAVSFARQQSGSAGCAIIFPAERFELDVANSGNPLSPIMGRLIRLAHGLWQSAKISTGVVHRR